MGNTEIFLSFEMTGRFLEICPLTTEIFVSQQGDLYDLSRLVKFVFEYVSDDVIPKTEEAMLDYLFSLPDSGRIHEVAQSKDFYRSGTSL